jgi:hypothetical protein
MQRSKKMFVGVSVLFFAGLVYLSYDISSRTTFPGSKPQLPERIKGQFLEKDSVSEDTILSVQRPK